MAYPPMSWQQTDAGRVADAHQQGAIDDQSMYALSVERNAAYFRVDSAPSMSQRVKPIAPRVNHNIMGAASHATLDKTVEALDIVAAVASGVNGE